MNHEKKNNDLWATLKGIELEDALAKLQAEKQLDLSMVEDKLHQYHLEQDSEIRQKSEQQFGEEKKELQRHQQRLKKEKVQEVMRQFIEEPLLQEIGEKMLERIEDAQKAQIREIDDYTDKKLEEARLRIVYVP